MFKSQSIAKQKVEFRTHPNENEFKLGEIKLYDDQLVIIGAENQVII